MRRAAKVDANHSDIIAALRAAGASVRDTHALPDGGGDITVGYLGLDQQIEIKDGSQVPSRRQLTPKEKGFHRDWRGRPVRVVESVDEALALLKEMRAAMTSSEVAP